MQPEQFKQMNEITALRVPKTERPVWAVLPGDTKLLGFGALYPSLLVALNVDGGLYLCEVMEKDDRQVIVKFAVDSYRAILSHWPSFRGARTVTEAEKKLWDDRPRAMKGAS